MHKSLFTKGFLLAAAEKLYDGAIAETANVVRALAIHNSTLLKRYVHADGQNQTQCESRSCANAVERSHTNSLEANDKLIQTRPQVRNTIASRKRQVVMRKGKSTIPPFLWLDFYSTRQNFRWLWLEGLVKNWLGHITGRHGRHSGAVTPKSSLCPQILLFIEKFVSSLFFEHIIAFYSVIEWSNFAVSVWSMACRATTLSHVT